MTLGNKTLCKHYNKGTSCRNLGPKGAYCTPNGTKRYFHLCAQDIGGQPCGKRHGALEHRG